MLALDLPEPTFNFSSKPDGDGGKAQAQPSSFGKGGSAAKGGKGTKASNGVKIAAKEPLQLKIDPELLKNAECLMDSEAANILMGVQEQMVELSKDSDIKLPVTFDKALQYAKGSTQYTNTHSVRQVLEYPSNSKLFIALKVHGVTDGEICVLANVCPESVDEVFALVPSLKVRCFVWIITPPLYYLAAIISSVDWRFTFEKLNAGLAEAGELEMQMAAFDVT
ncbi:hypothetical protein ACFE04_005710 [Oxalis oulophora]